MMLEIKKLECGYGKLKVLMGVDLHVGMDGTRAPESVGLFGPNGAGKTTLINAVMGIGKAWSGSGADFTWLKTVLLGWMKDLRCDIKFCAREKRLGELPHAARIRWRQRQGKLAGFRQGWKESHPL